MLIDGDFLRIVERRYDSYIERLQDEGIPVFIFDREYMHPWSTQEERELHAFIRTCLPGMAFQRNPPESLRTYAELDQACLDANSTTDPDVEVFDVMGMCDGQIWRDD